MDERQAVLIIILDYSRKKWGVEDMEFLGVLMKEPVEIPGVNQKRISRGVQERLM